MVGSVPGSWLHGLLHHDIVTLRNTQFWLHGLLRASHSHNPPLHSHIAKLRSAFRLMPGHVPRSFFHHCASTGGIWPFDIVIKKISSDSCESKKTFQTCYHFSLSASHDTDLTECLSALLRDKGRNPLPPYSELYLLHIILLLSAPLRSHVQLHFFYPSQLRIPSREFSVKSPAVYSFRLSVFMIFKSVAHPNLIVKPRHYLYISYTYPGNIMTVFLY